MHLSTNGSMKNLTIIRLKLVFPKKSLIVKVKCHFKKCKLVHNTMKIANDT